MRGGAFGVLGLRSYFAEKKFSGQTHHQRPTTTAPRSPRTCRSSQRRPKGEGRRRRAGSLCAPRRFAFQHERTFYLEPRSQVYVHEIHAQSRGLRLGDTVLISGFNIRVVSPYGGTLKLQPSIMPRREMRFQSAFKVPRVELSVSCPSCVRLRRERFALCLKFKTLI